VALLAEECPDTSEWCMSVCVYVYACICMRMRVYVCVYVCVCMCARTRMIDRAGVKVRGEGLGRRASVRATRIKLVSANLCCGQQFG